MARILQFLSFEPSDGSNSYQNKPIGRLDMGRVVLINERSRTGISPRAPGGGAIMNSAADIKRFLLAFLFTIAGFSLLFFVLTVKVV